MMRPDPRSFGRKKPSLSDAQRSARFAALALFGLALVSFGGSLKIESAGGVVLLTALSFVALLAATIAAGEA